MASIPNIGIDDDRALIERMGGSTKVARLLNLQGQHPVQRVQNWMQRGIPSSVKLQYPQHFMPKLVAAQPATDSVATR